MERVSLLGVPIDPVTQEQAITQLEEFLEDGGRHHVMTPNSEMLVRAAQDIYFHDLLQTTALNIPDSVGLLMMAAKTGQHLPERVTGVDTVIALCAKLGSEHPVYLLGAAPGVAAKAAHILQQKNMRLRIAGTSEAGPEADGRILQDINESGAHVLLVAYGAPVQDQWIALHMPALPNVRIAMGVGGTFDFIAGKRKRAPKWMQAVGLEWLWRVIQEPSRIGRIWTAVVTFPSLVKKYGAQSPHPHSKNN